MIMNHSKINKTNNRLEDTPSSVNPTCILFIILPAETQQLKHTSGINHVIKVYKS